MGMSVAISAPITALLPMAKEAFAESEKMKEESYTVKAMAKSAP
jgi:hypothetical protein